MFLFLGLTTPYICYGDKIEANIGLILALADAMAAFMGKSFGVIEMPGTKKTLIGFIAFSTTSFLCQYLLEF